MGGCFLQGLDIFSSCQGLSSVIKAESLRLRLAPWPLLANQSGEQKTTRPVIG